VASLDPLIGSFFDGRYKIVRKLGAGGMANVYLAEDQELGRRVAIKILNDRHANDDQFVERFRREAKNAAALSHPNIVSIYDRGEAEGTYYIAMEYLDGRSLKELIVTRGPAPVPVAVEYARQILSALRFAHRHGIVHRDIKPHNVLVDGEGRVKVTDFGIARAGASQMTEVGSIVGTAQYLSPEQARGTNVDQRSDLYSLGVVLYELLTGSAPFGGDTPVEIAMKHLSQVPEPPSAKRPNLPHDLDLLVMRALAKDPDERYQSAEEMDADLERVARGVSVSRETEESATQILSAQTGPMAATAATMIAPPPRAIAPAQGPPSAPPQVYYDLDEPIHRRPIWHRRLVPVPADLEEDLLERAGRGRVLRQPDPGRCRGEDPGDRPHPGRAEGAEPRHGARPRLQAGADRGQQDPEGQPGDDLDLDREAEGGGADPRRPAGVGCGQPAEGAAPETGRARRQLEHARERGYGAGPEGRHEARRRELGADQRLEGAGAGGRAERRRQPDRPGDSDVAGGRLQLGADVRRLEPAGEHRRQPEPGRRLVGGEGLDRQLDGLEGAEDDAGAGRDEPRRRHGDEQHPGGEPQGAHRQRHGDGSVPGRDRPEPEPAGRCAGAGELDGDDQRRPIQRRHDDGYDADTVTAPA
jgi:predicted Ser/Thr protein kinase